MGAELTGWAGTRPKGDDSRDGTRLINQGPPARNAAAPLYSINVSTL